MVTFYSRKPAFLEDFTYCLEINKKGVHIQGQESQPTFNPYGAVKCDTEVQDRLRCTTCFSSHFPRPNTIICKGTRSNRKRTNITTPRFYPMRLRGGAGTRGAMLEKAM